jgi:hypothetical protein
MGPEAHPTDPRPDAQGPHNKKAPLGGFPLILFSGVPRFGPVRCPRHQPPVPAAGTHPAGARILPENPPDRGTFATAAAKAEPLAFIINGCL